MSNSKMSRRCIPYTPSRRSLSETVVALVSVAGVHLVDQEPWQSDSDSSVREIPGVVESSRLIITHAHYDHSAADRDINLMFPIDRLRELAATGELGGAADTHYSFGYTTNLREMYEQAAPSIADDIERSRTDAVLLTAG